MTLSFEHHIILFSVFQMFWRLSAVTESFIPYQESALGLWSHSTLNRIKNLFKFNTFQGYTQSFSLGWANFKFNITGDDLTTINLNSVWKVQLTTWEGWTCWNRLTEPWLNLNWTPLKCSDSTILTVPNKVVFSLKFVPGRSLCLKKHTNMLTRWKTDDMDRPIYSLFFIFCSKVGSRGKDERLTENRKHSQSGHGDGRGNKAVDRVKCEMYFKEVRRWRETRSGPISLKHN